MDINREIIVLGDIEMGGGTLTDDFISDKALSELIQEISAKEHPVDLVFNGDTFDFLKCPSIVNSKKHFPRHITEEISINKLDLIHSAHKIVFTALKDFVKKESHHLYFILGNHDPDLIYSGVQAEIKILLQNSAQVHFPGFRYHYSKVYAEHGHQYDFLNRMNRNHHFLNYRGNTILNVPWVSFGLISGFMEMKEQHPFMERVFPRPMLFAQHKNLLKIVTLRSLSYLVKSMVYYPFRYHYDPTYTFPRELLREFYRRYKNVHWDVGSVVDKFKKKNKKVLKKYAIHILGHVHDKYLEEKRDKVIIHPGAWRDEYDLDTKTRKLIPREKRYVQILIDESGSAEWKFLNYPVLRNTILLDDVIKDEYSYIKIAAEEEGYNLNF